MRWPSQIRIIYFFINLFSIVVLVEDEPKKIEDKQLLCV